MEVRKAGSIDSAFAVLTIADEMNKGQDYC